jgi:hypothetical protein
VFPRVPVRQWVLSLPHRLRYRLAWDHTLCRAVVGRTMRAILGFLRRRARAEGVMDGRSGAVVIVQRFGGALNLNVHFHALVLDGVFARHGDTVRFHPCPPLDAADVEEVLATVTAYVGRLLAQGGSGEGDDGGMLDEWADEAPVLAELAAASVQGRVALGSRAGARVRRRAPWAGATAPSGLGSCHARHDGFDLHAGLRVRADERDRLDPICRYALRPPVAHDRLQLTDDGQVRLALRRPWADGTTHLFFDPVALLERLAALTPRPRINLILYHGVLAPRAAWRSRVVQFGASPGAAADTDPATDGPRLAADCRHTRNYRWAALMRLSLGLDVLACPRCGGRLTLIALIEDPAVIARILRHLGLPTAMPEAQPARAPPLHLVVDAPLTEDAGDQIHSQTFPAIS